MAFFDRTVNFIIQRDDLLHRPYLIKKTTRRRRSKIADFDTTYFMDDPLGAGMYIAENLV